MRKRTKHCFRNADMMMDTVAAFGIALIDVRAARKTGQICKEVSRTLSCALGASRDALIRELTIVAVEPAPDAARLLVTVCPLSTEPTDVQALKDRLHAQTGALRTEVAAALQRKRTPELSFHVALTGGRECVLGC